MLDKPQIVQTEAETTAVIRFTIPRSEIQSVMGPAIAEVMATVAKQGVERAGPVFSHHFAMNPKTFDFEVGVPVKTPVKAEGRVVASTLPSLKAARTIYRGPYEGLGAAWGEFEEWFEQADKKAAPGLWEKYVKGPESGSDASKWETELTRPFAA